MKRKIIYTVLILLLFIGIGLIGTSIYVKYETKVQENDMIQQYINSENNKTNIVNDISRKGVKNTRNNLESNSTTKDVIGIIEIPSIGVKAPIVEGTTWDDMKYAVGHFDNTAEPGEKGNTCFAAHDNIYGDIFSDLSKVKNGEKIIVDYNGEKYMYEVTSQSIVKPDNVSVLEKTKDATMTLVTCTPGATERIIVKGKIIQ